MKKILVPTDFCECARAAEDMALAFGKKAGAEVDFLHIIHTPVNWSKLPKDREKDFPETLHSIGHAQLEFEELVKKAETSGVKARKFLVYANGGDEITDYLKNYSHDFIIMGSHGVRGIRGLFIGSNAQKVIRISSAPVLVVKSPKAQHNGGVQVKNMVFASDFDREASGYFSDILDFAKVLGAHIHLLYVNVPA